MRRTARPLGVGQGADRRHDRLVHQLESAYTKPLAVAWATCARAALDLPAASVSPTVHQRKRAIFEPEFGHLLTLAGPGAALYAALAPPCTVPGATWPKGTKLTAYDRERHLAVLRVPLEPRQWCERALLLPHPAVAMAAPPKGLLAAVQAETGLPPAALARLRARDLKRRRLDLAPAEQALRRGLLLLADALRQCGHPDTRLPTEVREGFLAGWLEPSGLWPTDVQPPSLPSPSLRTLAAEVSAPVWRGWPACSPAQ